MKTVKRISTTERAAQEIKRYLLSGVLQPGDKISTETEFAERLGVGRSTVREAIRTLQATGYVELRPGRGAFALITSPDAERSMRDGAIRYFKDNQGSLKDFLEVRSLIEPYAAALAAERADEETCLSLKAIFDRFVEATRETPDRAELARLELEFHSTIVAASDNKMLLTIFRQLCRNFTVYSENCFTAYNSLAATTKEHADVVDAILRHDRADAEKYMRIHLALACQNMQDAIREQEGK